LKEVKSVRKKFSFVQVKSLSLDVPSGVPSVTKRSWYSSPSRAKNSSRPLTGVKFAGWAPSGPGLRSLSSRVPCGVPSLVHSSHPVAGSYIRNTSRPDRSPPMSCVA